MVFFIKKIDFRESSLRFTWEGIVQERSAWLHGAKVVAGLARMTLVGR